MLFSIYFDPEKFFGETFTRDFLDDSAAYMYATTNANGRPFIIENIEKRCTEGRPAYRRPLPLW